MRKLILFAIIVTMIIILYLFMTTSPVPIDSFDFY